MKQIIFALLTLITFSANAQIILYDEYPENFEMQTATIEGEALKFIGIDTLYNTVNIYNPDHSLWKVINTNLPQGTKFSTVNNFYASKHLFNDDDFVEVCFVYTNPTNNTNYFVIINEVGTVKNIVAGIHEYHLVNQTVNNKTQWFLWMSATELSDGMGTLNHKFTKIYSLKGQWTGVNHTAKKVANNSTIYPNPMSDYATIKYNLPSNVQIGIIKVYDMTGREVKQFNIDRQFNNIKVNRDNLPSGEYIYKIEAGNEMIATNKFVVM